MKKSLNVFSKIVDQRLYILLKYLLFKSQVEIGHTFIEISLNPADFKDFFLNRNVVPFCFNFLLIMLSHPFCFLKPALFKARKLWIFKIFPLQQTSSAQ